MNAADIGFRALSGVGVPSAAARRLAPLGFGLMLLLAIAVAGGVLWGGWAIFDHLNDRKAVEAATNAGNAQFRAKQVTAERTAGAAKDARDSSDAAESNTLQEKIDAAEANGSSAADDVWGSGLFDDKPG